MKRLLQTLYGSYSLGVFAASALVTCTLIVITPGQRLRRRIGGLGMRLALALAGIRLRLEGLAHLPDRPCVVVANHASYLDGLVMTAALPPHFGFVIKAEASRVPIMGLVLRRMGASFVTRSDPRRASRETRALLRSLKRGESLAVFPEGTFSPRPGLLPFRLGAFVLAARAAAPVIPAAILGTRNILPDKVWLPRHNHIRIRLLPPLSSSGSAREQAAQLRDLAHAAVRQALTKDS